MSFFVLLAVLYVGILYIVTTDGVGNIAQAAVAISFINELDNMSLLLYGTEAELAVAGRYRTESLFDDPPSR